MHVSANAYGTFAHPGAQIAPATGMKLIASSSNSAPMDFPQRNCSSENMFLVKLRLMPIAPLPQRHGTSPGPKTLRCASRCFFTNLPSFMSSITSIFSASHVPIWSYALRRIRLNGPSPMKSSASGSATFHGRCPSANRIWKPAMNTFSPALSSACAGNSTR